MADRPDEVSYQNDAEVPDGVLDSVLYDEIDRMRGEGGVAPEVFHARTDAAQASASTSGLEDEDVDIDSLSEI